MLETILFAGLAGGAFWGSNKAKEARDEDTQQGLLGVALGMGGAAALSLILGLFGIG